MLWPYSLIFFSFLDCEFCGIFNKVCFLRGNFGRRGLGGFLTFCRAGFGGGLWVYGIMDFISFFMGEGLRKSSAGLAGVLWWKKGGRELDLAR